MDLLYRKAGIRDLDMLTETRIQVLRAANHLDETVDMSKVRQESYDYYAQALRDGTHTAYLVFDGDLLVKEARRAGIPFITLEATSMGRPLYEKYGFVGMRDEMELPGGALDA